MSLILVQAPWSAGDAGDALDDLIRAAADTSGTDGPHIVLFAQGEVDETDPPSEQVVVEHMCRHAKAQGVFLAGSAILTVDSGRPARHVGFVCGPDGTRLLRAVKALPDVVDGFSDAASSLCEPMDFQVARTSVGTLGLVLGEDILSPHIVRSVALNGAEILLNPSRERSDNLLESRLNARGARAYENIAYVACASPLSVKAKGFVTQLPPASRFCIPAGQAKTARGQETFVVIDVDLEVLRRQRKVPFANFLAILRNRLYAPDYETNAKDNRESPATRQGWQAEGGTRVEAIPEPRSGDDRIDQYDVILTQTNLHNVTDLAHRDEVIEKNLRSSLKLAGGVASLPHVKLVVFPEYWLQGVVGGRSVEEWTQVAMTVPGPETDRLCAFAQQRNTYVAGGVFEYDPRWPHRWFNTAIIIDDQGNLIHRYRKIQCADLVGLLPDTTPGNLYSAYVKEYGYDGLFPVVDTSIGKLATIICFDMNFPETSRALVRRGAEVLIHPTAEPHGMKRQGWDLGRMTRAFENTAYVISCSEGGEFFGADAQHPSTLHRGYSKIVNFDGVVAGVADGPGETFLQASIDLAALRRARANPRVNLAAWDEPAVYGHVYRDHDGFPNDVWLDTPMETTMEGIAEVKKVVDRYAETGIFVAPDFYSPPPGSHTTRDSVLEW